MSTLTPNYTIEQKLDMIQNSNAESAVKILLRELIEEAALPNSPAIGLQSVLENGPNAVFTDGNARILGGAQDNKSVYFNTNAGSAEASVYEQRPNRVNIIHANYNNNSSCGIQVADDLIFTRDFDQKVAKVTLGPSANNVNFNFPSDKAGNQTIAMKSDCVKPYKSYVAILNQQGSSTSVTSIIMENDFPSAIVWTLNPLPDLYPGIPAPANYRATLPNAFTLNKTAIIVYNGDSGTPISYVFGSDSNTFEIRVAGGNYGFLKNAFIEVRVYN